MTGAPKSLFKLSDYYTRGDTVVELSTRHTCMKYYIIVE
jgi:hypothetical protein